VMGGVTVIEIAALLFASRQLPFLSQPAAASVLLLTNLQRCQHIPISTDRFKAAIRSSKASLAVTTSTGAAAGDDNGDGDGLGAWLVGG